MLAGSEGGTRVTGAAALRRQTAGVVREVSVAAAAGWVGGMEGCRDFVGAAHGTDDAHRAVAAQANGHVDTKDAGEQAHPRETVRCPIELLERRLGAGRQFELSLEDKQGQLLGLGAVGLCGGDDASAQGVPGREDSVVPNRVRPGGGTKAHSLAKKRSGVMSLVWFLSPLAALLGARSISIHLRPPALPATTAPSRDQIGTSARVIEPLR